MTDRDLGPGGAGNSGSGLVDIAIDHIGTSTGSSVGTGQTGGGNAVEILTSDRDTSNGASKTRELLDGGLQGGDLLGESSITTRCPHTEQQRGVCVLSGLESSDGSVGSAILNHGVETGRGEAAAGTRETLCGCEFILEVIVGLGGSVA